MARRVRLPEQTLGTVYQHRRLEIPVTGLGFTSTDAWDYQHLSLDMKLGQHLSLDMFCSRELFTVLPGGYRE